MIGGIDDYLVPNKTRWASIGIRDSVGLGILGAGGVDGVGSRMEEGWGLTVWPVNSHPSVWKLVAGSVLVAALLPWSQSGPFYSRQMLGGRWWGPRYVRHPAPFLQFMWICVNWWFLLCAPVCFDWTDSEPEFCSGRYIFLSLGFIILVSPLVCLRWEWKRNNFS